MTWRYESTWQRLENTAREKKGSIHDDDAARSLGFRKAFVPGSVVANHAMPAILDRYGRDWFAGGWYDFNFVSPVYIDEDVHTLAEEAGNTLACRVETRDARLCADGRAGLGDGLPWNTQGAIDPVFPEAVIGRQFRKTVEIDRQDAAPMLAASHDKSLEWDEWVPPEQLMGIALRMIDFKQVPLRGVAHPGMWAQHAISVRRPLRWNTPYRIREHLAEKGASGRTQYVSFQFHVVDSDDSEVAIGRHKCKFLRKD